MKALTSSLALCTMLMTSGAVQAATAPPPPPMATTLIDRGGGLIYDAALNVTWLQNANANGLMTWSQATAWAANLSYYDSVRNVTYTDWRLPTTGPVDGSTFNYNTSYNGSSDYSYNISEQSTVYAGSTGSEMAHLYYNSLANKGFVTPSSLYPSFTLQAGFGLVNDPTNPNDESLFINFLPSNYWSGTAYAPLNGVAWRFGFGGGLQDPDAKDSSWYAMAVRDGDVAAVPVPPAAWLLGSGLLGLIGVVRRKAA